MKNKYSKDSYWKFKDHLSEESKNVVFYHLLTIIEEENPKLFEEVEHLVDRNLVKDELIESISVNFHIISSKFVIEFSNSSGFRYVLCRENVLIFLHIGTGEYFL